MKITLELNGTIKNAEVDAGTRLIDMLRGEFGLTGVREGCGAGECGACTVLFDGNAVCACVVPAVQADGHAITTIEGLEKNGELDIIQQAFVEFDATQCGFCTPGMIMSAKALLLKKPRPTRDEIKRAIAGNICRCTGYIPIVNAVEAAAERLEGRETWER